MIIDSYEFSKKPLIFIHIPKTGGMSCLHFLSYYKSITHTTIKEDLVTLAEKDKNLQDFFSFTIVRNPWDRMVSNYFFHRNRDHNDKRLHKKIEKSELKKWINDHIKENKFWRNITFKDWLKYFDENERLDLVSIYDPIIKMNYLDYIGIDGKVSVDYVINLSNISNEISVIKDISGTPNHYPHKNKSDHEDYRSYYDSKSTEIVANAFKKDIEAFNFKFDDKSYAENEKYWNKEKIKKFSRRIPII